MINLTPWQLLLWIAAVGMIMVPLIGILCTSIINAHYKAKEQYTIHIVTLFMKAIGGATEAVAKTIEKKEKEDAKRRKDQSSDSHPNP